MMRYRDAVLGHPEPLGSVRPLLLAPSPTGIYRAGRSDRARAWEIVLSGRFPGDTKERN